MTYAHAWESSAPSAYEIHTSPDASVGHRARRDTARVGVAEPGSRSKRPPNESSAHYALASQGLSRLTQIRLLVLIAAMLAVAGAIGAMIWQRRDLVAFIKCEGYRRGVLWRWLLLRERGAARGRLLRSEPSSGSTASCWSATLLASVTGFPISLNVEAFAAVSSLHAGQRRRRRGRCPAGLPRCACASEDRQSSVLTRTAAPQAHQPSAALGGGNSECSSPRATRELTWGLPAVSARGARVAVAGDG